MSSAMESNQHVFLISCPDSQGLVHKITGVLFRHKLNVIENQEYVDRHNKSFFMRTEVMGEFDRDTVLGELKKELPTKTEIGLYPQTAKNLVILVTKEPHCLGDLLLHQAAGDIKAKISAVVSQYDYLRELTERFDIPFHHVPVGEKTRAQHEVLLEKIIDPYNPDLLVLAKYMRILSPKFVAKYKNRIINIHHSFLPAFKGEKPYTQAYERGVKIIGATAHFVNEALDEGPIITQEVVRIDHTQDAASLARSGKAVERAVLTKAVNLLIENRVIVQKQRTLVFE
jgi:formyltetrahydrofolate deformylase